jgi:hypothetical protein
VASIFGMASLRAAVTQSLLHTIVVSRVPFFNLCDEKD